MSLHNKILYVSDLDGTLLRQNERTSDFTNSVINSLVKKGMYFSYATARSYLAASQATSGLIAKFPVITQNGAFILENETQKFLLSNYLTANEVKQVREILNEKDLNPIVFSYLNNEEKFSYLSDKINYGTQFFLDRRKGDVRKNPVSASEELYCGNPFAFLCTDAYDKLLPVYQALQSAYSCNFYKDIYSCEQCLEIHPKKATKANAVLQLKKHLGCDKVVCFGDAENDISMFKISDECYTVENAVEELKSIATGIIAGNNDDGVAKWLAIQVKL